MTAPDEPQFHYRTSRDEVVTVFFRHRPVTTLRGNAAARFLRRVHAMDETGAQVEMARVTGNFKHGNERVSRTRERSKG